MRPVKCLGWRQETPSANGSTNAFAASIGNRLLAAAARVSRDMEIFYPENRFINFYIVPLVMEQREPT